MSTAHKAEGRECNDVRIGDGFGALVPEHVADDIAQQPALATEPLTRFQALPGRTRFC